MTDARDLLPQYGFLPDYVGYCQEQTDAPVIFHVAAGLGILSVVAMNVGIRAGYYTIKPNLWILLLAPTSFYRKSTAIMIAKDILWGSDSSLIYPSEFSKEAIITTMASRRGVFVWSEFGGVLAAMNKEYMAGTKDMFADLYDCPPEYIRKLQKDEVKITDPYFVILAASSLIWFKERVTESDMHGGFLTRFLFCIPDKKENYMELQPPCDWAKRKKLIEWAQHVRSISGDMGLHPDAERYYRQWARAKETVLEDRQLAGYENKITNLFLRSTQQCLKIAMLLELSKSGLREISAGTMAEASILVDGFYDYAKDTLSRELETNKELQKFKRIIAIIKGAKGKMKRSELMRLARYNVREFDSIIHTLLESDQITVINEKIGDSRKPSTVYTLNDKVIAEQLLE